MVVGVVSPSRSPPVGSWRGAAVEGVVVAETGEPKAETGVEHDIVGGSGETDATSA